MNEILLTRLLASLTPRRAANLLKTAASFLISALREKPLVWGVPPVLTIEPTNMCNLQCPLCTTGAGEMERVAGRMTLDTFNNILEKIGDDIFFLLIYHQGEPYMNKNFFDFVRSAKDKNIYVTTSTNGHYFTADNVAKTLDCGLDSMIISIDGVTQNSYETYRVGGSLERVIKGTRLLMSEKKRMRGKTPNVALQFLVMKHNESEIAEMRSLAAELGVDRFLVKDIEVRSKEEAKKWLPQDEKYRRYNYNGDAFTVKNINKKSCVRPWMSTLINWDGSVVACCFDKNATYPLGDINGKGNFTDIWMGESYAGFRSQLLENRRKIDICSNCNQGFGSISPVKFIRGKKSGKSATQLENPTGEVV